MKTIIASTLLPAALIAAPAFAGNIEPAPVEPAPVFVEPAAPAYDWTGPYVGGQLSYGDVETGGDAEFEGDGALYGLRAGYDFDLGPAIVGGLIQYDFGSIDLEDGDEATEDGELEDILRVGGRVGFDFGPNLIYVNGGYAQASTDDFGDTDGYFAGLGYERFLTQNLSLGAEAMYHDFDDLDDAGDGVDVDAEATTAGINLNYRF